MTAIGIVLGVFAVGAVAFALANRGTDPFADLTPMPVTDFLDNGNSLSGNSYRLTGIVDEKLRYTSNNGQLISVEVEGELVPLLVPAKLNGTNISRGDRFTFKVEVQKGGKLLVHELAKS